jgi:hypothetical protein
MTSTVRRVGAAGLMVGLCLGAAGAVPASADTGAPVPVPAVGGLLGAVDGGLLGGLVGSLLHGQGGVFGPDGGVFAGSNTVGDVVQGLTGSGGDNLLGSLGALSAVGDALANPQIGGNGSFGSPSVGGGPVGGVAGGLLGGGGLLGSLLGGGAGLLGGIL